MKPLNLAAFSSISIPENVKDSSPHKIKILLVDDQPSNLTALESILNHPEYELVRTTSGKEALLRLLQDDFSLILLDVLMPGMDGFETAALIRSRKQTQHIPIIFLTANSPNDSCMTRGYSLGAVDYIYKPIIAEILKAKVHVFVDLFKKTAQLEKSEEALRRELDAHRQAQEARRETEEKYRALFSWASDAIMVFDAQTYAILDANKAALKLYGYSRKEFMRLRKQDLIADPDKFVPFGEYSGMNRTFVRCHKKKGGQTFPVEISDGVVTLNGKKIIMALTRDITERKKSEETERLRQLETLQRQFVATVSHELRTPITAIKGFTETLRRGAGDNAKTRASFIKIIEHHADKLGWLVEDLLTLSEIESGKHKCDPVPIKLLEYVRQFVLSLSPIAARKSVTIQIHIEKDLEVWVDQSHLAQILQNLVDNAIKYNKKGGSVLIEGRKINKKEAHITVRDTGIGVDEADLPLIFQQFHRSDNARMMAAQGTGLGLYIIKKLVETNGGRIWAESVKDSGSVFHFMVPLAQEGQGHSGGFPHVPNFFMDTRKFIQAALNTDKVVLRVERPSKIKRAV